MNERSREAALPGGFSTLEEADGIWQYAPTIRFFRFILRLFVYLRRLDRVHSTESPIRCSAAENFSLVQGGLTHRLAIRLRLADRTKSFPLREVLVAISITWLPLLILTLIEGSAYGHGIKISFLGDYSTNIRFLVTLPLLILAELWIDPHIREAVLHFVDSRLILPDQIPAYEEVLYRTIRLRDFWLPTIVVLLLAYGPSFWASGEILIRETSSWHYAPNVSDPKIGWAGLWFSFVSIPLYRLLLFRWVWLFIVWAVFLWRVTRLPLNCIPSHPDRAGGLGFLCHTALFFGIVIFATQASLAGAMANMLAYEGSTLPDLQFLIAGACILSIALTVAPLLMVSRKLFEVKQQGLFEYGTLGVAYADGFHRKWIRGERPSGEALLGSADIQSLADLGGSYEIVENMKVWLVDHEILLKLAVPALLPMLILIATATPADEILKALVHLLA